MNEHAGASCALSVLIVGVFAVLLHDKNPASPPPKPAFPSIAQRTAVAAGPNPILPASPPNPPTSLPELKPSPAPPAPVAVPPRPQRVEVTSSAPTVEIRVSEPPAVPVSRPVPRPARSPQNPALRPEVVARRAASKPKPVGPRPSSTVVTAGESLADVAVRVYGSAEAAEALWRANRDLLAGRDAPLAPGTLLRTP